MSGKVLVLLQAVACAGEIMQYPEVRIVMAHHPRMRAGAAKAPEPQAEQGWWLVMGDERCPKASGPQAEQKVPEGGDLLASESAGAPKCGSEYP